MSNKVYKASILLHNSNLIQFETKMCLISSPNGNFTLSKFIVVSNNTIFEEFTQAFLITTPSHLSDPILFDESNMIRSYS